MSGLALQMPPFMFWRTEMQESGGRGMGAVNGQRWRPGTPGWAKP